MAISADDLTILRLTIRIKVLEEELSSVCEENVWVTDEDRAQHNEHIDFLVEKRLREHYKK